jgi:hypothetical protein
MLAQAAFFTPIVVRRTGSCVVSGQWRRDLPRSFWFGRNLRATTMRIERRPREPPTRYSWLNTYAGFSGILCLAVGMFALVKRDVEFAMICAALGTLGLLIGYRQENSRK